MRDVIPEGVGRIGTLFVLGLTSLLNNLLGLMVPLLMMQVFNRIIPNQSINTLTMLVVAVLVALLVESALQTLRAHIVGWVGARYVHKGSCVMLRHLLFAEPRAFERVDGAKYLEQMNAIHLIGDLYSGQTLLALFDLPFLLLFLYMIYLLGGMLILVPLAVLLLVALFSTAMGAQLRKTLNIDMELTQRRFSFITETLSRIHSVKALSMEALMLRRYEMLQLGNLRQTHDILFNGGIVPIFSSFVSQVNTACVVGLGSFLVIGGEMTTGGLAACTMLAGRSLQPLQTLVRGWTRLQAIRLAKQQVREILALPQRPQLAANTATTTIVGALELRNVTCRFDERTTVLDGLSLEVMAGECIGLIGRSGDGKTTLLKLISGAIQPQSGSVLVDGLNRNALPEHLHAAIGYIPQVGVLFNATLLDNLTMFDESRVEIALQIAAKLGLDAIVARMPKGYQTPIGEGVSDILPAGVIQRIAMIRILAMQPKILLFDEANTAIDSAGDILLRNYLAELKGQVTVLLVSERPSLLRIADRCYQFRDGALAPLANFMDALTPPPTESVLPANGSEAPAVLATEYRMPSGGDPVNWHGYLAQLPGKNGFSVCLGALLEGLHWHGTGRQLAEAIPHLLGALDLTALCNIMANLNFSHKMEEGSIREVDSRLAPFLFVFGNGRPVVVLEKSDNGEMDVVDGTTGQRQRERLRGRGVAFFFAPVQPATPNRGRTWVRTQLERFRSLVWNIMGITIIGNLMSTAMPVYVMVVYDRVIPTGSFSTGVVMLIGTLLALTIDAILRVRRLRILAYIGTKLECSLSATILNQIMGMPASLTEQVSAGNQISRIRSLEVVREVLTGPLAILFYDIPTTILFLIVLGFVSPNVIALLMLLILAMVILGSILMPVVRQRSSVASHFSSQMQAFLTEALGRIQTIQNTHAEETWYKRFRDLSGKATLANFRLIMISSHFSTLSRILTLAAGVGVMSETARSVLSSDIDRTGAVIASMLLTWRILAPLQTFFLGISKIAGVVSSVTQLNRLMELPVERGYGVIPIARKQFKGEIAFARVSFRYTSDSEPALVGVSFRVAPGQVVAVIGANGSGKSTLIKMILGLYDPQAGSVLIDNNDIRQTNALQLRHAIGYLPQTCDIFFGTVAQNLRLVCPDASDAELEAATAQAGLLEEIRQLPEGFRTRLSDSRNELLSAGFKQRLSLARALLKNSSIMLFDEPANNLDATSEALFREAVARLRGNTTIFIVTHRPSHMKMADYVLYLDRGYLRAAGTPQEIEKLLPRGFV
ncbi:MAG: ATP-binding cassette domain-containing protein [Magnetococcales bacterium]|nr:ATP-binding cassette domain-containing protein [Magnetococcales bacterium]